MNFQEAQDRFTAHIRDPQQPLPEGLSERRMGIYSELLYANIESFIASAFPIFKAISEPQVWQDRVRDFLKNYRCESPYFVDISQAFLDYLSRNPASWQEDGPFILELAHYEWAELMLDTAALEIPNIPIDQESDLLNGCPIPSPVAQLFQYSYPVHTITPEQLPESPADQPVLLLGYRNRNDHVGFMEVNPVTARLWQLIQACEDTPKTGKELILKVLQELNHVDIKSGLRGGLEALEHLQQNDIVLGANVFG